MCHCLSLYTIISHCPSFLRSLILAPPPSLPFNPSSLHPLLSPAFFYCQPSLHSSSLPPPLPVPLSLDPVLSISPLSTLPPFLLPPVPFCLLSSTGILILGLSMFPIWALWLSTESVLLLLHQSPCVARFACMQLLSLTKLVSLLYLKNEASD